MTYLFGVTKHIKYVIPMIYTLKWAFQVNFQILVMTYFSYNDLHYILHSYIWY